MLNCYLLTQTLLSTKFFDEANKKFVGKMKDVSEGKIIDEFVLLK